MITEIEKKAHETAYLVCALERVKKDIEFLSDKPNQEHNLARLRDNKKQIEMKLVPLVTTLFETFGHTEKEQLPAETE